MGIGHLQSCIANAAATIAPANTAMRRIKTARRLSQWQCASQLRSATVCASLHTSAFDMLLLSLISYLLLLPASLAFKVTGATGGHNLTTGARPYRVDINDFAQSGPPFDLYIQALNQLQKTDQADPQSYFQIAGEQTRRVLSFVRLIR